jgi:thiamine-phosphate pyrophosphorylase
MDNPILLRPRLYPIIDFALFASQPDPVAAVANYAQELIGAGATLIQFRDKSEPAQPRRSLSCARELRRITLERALLIINDRVDICLAAGADGVHLGQDDLSPAAARRIFDSVESHPLRPIETPVDRQQSGPQRMGHPEFGVASAVAKNRLLIGYSTHNPDQICEADKLPVDYIAIGPVFATASKTNPDPVIGLEGVRAARRVTQKPLVAIGGITRQNCRQVTEAGADAVAVISDLFESPGKAVADFLRVLR